MAEYIRVQGVKENICNCIDFYQGLTKVGLVGVKELRKSYLDMYLADYIQRCNETLEKRTERKEEKKVSDTPEVSNHIKNTFEEKESGIDLFRNMLSTPEEVVYESHGVFIDENTVIEKEESTPVKDEVEYTNHGVFLEEVAVPTENIEASVDEIIDIEYVDHGIYVEDIVTDNSEPEDDYEEDYSEDDIEDEDSYEDEEDEDGYEYEDYDETDDSTDYIEEKEEDDTEEDDEEYVSSKSLRNKRVVDDYGDFEFLDYKDTTSAKEEVVEESKAVSTEEVKPEAISSEERVKPEAVKPEIREIIEKPKFQDYKNVRDFVKKNPGCSYSDVKEFFSMKEIQKALLNTKIVEKKNKLYVV
jgi:hypothetical protein